MNGSILLWLIGIVIVLSIFFFIGKLYYYSDEKKDNISNTFSIFYSPSIFTLIVSLRTLAVSNFDKSDKPIRLILQALYFGFAVSLMLNLLNLILLQSDSTKKSNKHFLFYLSLLFNAVSFSLWLILAYLLFEIM